MTRLLVPPVPRMLSALFFTMALASCQKVIDRDLPDNPADPATLLAKTARSTTAPVKLKITFRNADEDKIRSDVNAAYIHGTDNVSAYFDQYGNLQFDTNPLVKGKKVVAVRWLNFDFGVSGLPNTNTHPTGNYRMVSQLNGGKKAQDLSWENCTVEPCTQLIKLGGGFQDGLTTYWNFSFRYNDVANTSFARITRIDQNTWTIEGEITNPDTDPVCRLTYSGNSTFHKMPFYMTLVKI